MKAVLLVALLVTAMIRADAQVAPSLRAPGGLGPAATPQFVLLTHDDSVSHETHAMMQSLTAGKRTASGCNLTATMFVCTNCFAQTDCALVRDLYDGGYEIADHSINHQQMADWSLEQIRSEVVGGRAAVAACGIPARDIVGWRTPYLQSKPEVRSVLHNNGFLYDSSLVEDGAGSSVSRGPGARIWPWAMGHGIPIKCATYKAFQRCSPGESYPGLFQVPLWVLEAPGEAPWMDYGRCDGW